MVFLMVASTLGKLFKETRGFQRSPVLRILAMDGEGTQSFVRRELTSWSSYPIFYCVLPCILGDNTFTIPYRQMV